MNYREWRLRLHELQLSFDTWENAFPFDGTEETYNKWQVESKRRADELTAHYDLEGAAIEVTERERA